MGGDLEQFLLEHVRDVRVSWFPKLLQVEVLQLVEGEAPTVLGEEETQLLSNAGRLGENRPEGAAIITRDLVETGQGQGRNLIDMYIIVSAIFSNEHRHYISISFSNTDHHYLSHCRISFFFFTQRTSIPITTCM